MKLKGERVLKANRSDVWERLIDASTLQKCIPGRQSISGSPENPRRFNLSRWRFV